MLSRKLILIAFAAILSVASVNFNGYNMSQGRFEINAVLEENTRTSIATHALEIMVSELEEYKSTINYFDSSNIVGMYLRQLSFPVQGIGREYSYHHDPLPLKNARNQVSWMIRNFPEYTSVLKLVNLTDDDVWKDIDPGYVIIANSSPTDIKVNNTASAFVVAGYTINMDPVLVYLQPYTKSIITLVGLEQLSKILNAKYSAQDVIYITLFDPLAALNRGSLWNKSGKVVPNSKILDVYDYVVTVNIYDGTTSVYERITDWVSNKYLVGTTWDVVDIGGYSESYAIIGSLLPANSTIGNNFYSYYKNQIYDSDYGIYISRYGVYQHSWTPQMIGSVEGTLYLYGFGGLSGSTDITVIHPMQYDNSGDMIQGDIHSDFTLHKVPDVKTHAMYARRGILATANSYIDQSKRGPIPYPLGSVSSGCVNYDEITWNFLSSFMRDKLSKGYKVGVVLSYPEFDQSLIPTIELYKLPFTGVVFWKTWCIKGECDWVDRRAELTLDI